MSSNTIHLIQHPANPFFISYQYAKCNTWNCFNFLKFIPTFNNYSNVSRTHWCMHCGYVNYFNKLEAANLILRKHDIILDNKSITFDVTVVDKMSELISFYKLLGLKKEKPDRTLINFNPCYNMFD